MDTRPLILGQTRTGVKFEDCVAKCNATLKKAVKAGRLTVVDIGDKAPNFFDKVFSVDKYKNQFPIQVFNPQARGWRKDLIGFQPKSEDDQVVLLSTCSPGDYERELMENLAPTPWEFLAPLYVQPTPVSITDMQDLLDDTVATIADKRIPINIDATPNKGTVDMFWTYQRQFTVDVPMGEFAMKGRTPEEDPETHAQVLDGWRRSLVGAMRQGYFLIIKMGDSNLDMKAFCREDLFPYCVFASGEVEAQEVRERLYRTEDMEHNSPVLRQGFGVVITTNSPLDSFKKHLKLSIPLRNMKALVVM